MIVLICIMALVLDLIIGDPPKWPHPVNFIAKLVQALEKRLNKGSLRKWKGVLLWFVVVGVTFCVVLAITVVSYRFHLGLGVAVEVVLIASGLAQRSLRDAAQLVYRPLVAGDLTEARQKLSWIVGRDTAHLNEAEITRGVVETVSENTSDGVTAPLFFAVLFGAPGIWAYKAANTLDSMIGYKNERYGDIGMFSARMDDVLNFVPSRITGLLILLCTKNDTHRGLRQRFRLWRVDAKKHPSPNSGWLEAATAYQLGIQLGGENVYQGVASFRALMGERDQQLQAVHITKTITQMHGAVFAFACLIFSLRGIFDAVT